MRYLVAPLVTTLLLVGCAKEAPPANTDVTATTVHVTTSSPASSDKLKPLADRDPQLAKKLVAAGAVLLDVRTPAEWNERHLDGASLIPVDELDGRLEEVAKLTGGDKNKPIVVYCHSGGRAGRAKKKLLKAGYTQVTNLGGINDWPSE